MDNKNKLFVRKILIDLDGVLNEYGDDKFDENCIPKIKDGAKEFLKKLSMKNELYLFTTRNLMLATKWLINNNIDCYFRDVTSVKLPSYLYIEIEQFVLRVTLIRHLKKLKASGCIGRNKLI